MTKRKSQPHLVPIRSDITQWRSYGTQHTPSDDSQIWREEHELDNALDLARMPTKNDRLASLESKILSDYESHVPEMNKDNRLWFSSGMMAAGFAFGIICGALLTGLIAPQTRAPLVAFLEMPIDNSIVEFIPQ